MIRQQMLVNQTSSFQAFVFESNQKVVPDSARLTIFKPGGSTELVSDQAMSVTPDGLLTYNLTADDNGTVDGNYKAVILYVVSGTTFTAVLFYDVVHSKLVKVITDEDVVSELPQLRTLNGWRINGTASSGTTTTIVDLNLTVYEDDHFTGGTAYSIDKGETRAITDFGQVTGTVTTEAFSGAISTDKYVLTRSYTKEIQRAFDKLEERLRAMGRRSHLILDPYDLREVHIYMSVAEITKGLAVEEESLWWEFWKSYDKLAGKTLKALNFKYDQSEDGFLAGSEEADRFRTLKSGRG